VLETLPRGELTRRAQQIAARLYDIPHTRRRRVSVDTLLEWALRYRRQGLDGLTPQPRQDRGQLRVITPETAALIERLKRESPPRTGAALLSQLALEAKARNQTGSSARAGSPSASFVSTKPPRPPTKSTKPNTPIRSGSPTCSSALG
jgi:hypothetical protein